MINAGIKILPFSGTQVFDTVSGNWSGIAVTARYPSDQNKITNPISIGDAIVEPTSGMWEVMAVVDTASGNDFVLSLRSLDVTPSADIAPGLGLVSRGAITTPVNGQLAPYWNGVLVSTEISRIVEIYNLSILDNTLSGLGNAVTGLGNDLSGLGTSISDLDYSVSAQLVDEVNVVTDPYTLSPDVVDGDLCYLYLGVISKSVTQDRSANTNQADPDYIGVTTGNIVADVTNGIMYYWTSLHIPERLKAILLANITENDCYLWSNPVTPGTLTTIDPLVSHGLTTGHIFFLTDTGELIRNNAVKRGTATYLAKEGEDISLKLNALLLTHENIHLKIPAGVTCNLTRETVNIGDGYLNVRCDGRLDVRVKLTSPNYMNNGPWYICGGFYVQGGRLYMGGEGEIHHHIPPGTKLYPHPSQLINVNSYSAHASKIALVSHNLDFYTTIGILGVAGAGTKTDFYMAGVNLFTERVSASVVSQPYFADGSWSFGDSIVTFARSGVSATGFSAIPASGLYTGSQITGNYSSSVIA